MGFFPARNFQIFYYEKNCFKKYTSQPGEFLENVTPLQKHCVKFEKLDESKYGFTLPHQELSFNTSFERYCLPIRIKTVNFGKLQKSADYGKRSEIYFLHVV